MRRVQPVVGPKHNQFRAEALRLPDCVPGLDAPLFLEIALGQDDAVPRVRIARDRDGFAVQFCGKSLAGIGQRGWLIESENLRFFKPVR